MGIWQFQWENWDQLNIHCNIKDLERISMDIIVNCLCLELQLNCMQAQKGRAGTENGNRIIILN